jgi:hypothetical protein
MDEITHPETPAASSLNVFDILGIIKLKSSALT